MNELHLFAGAGGGILGGMLLGHSCVCAVEIDGYCRSVLLQRQRDGILPRFPIWDNVRTFDGRPWCGHVDVVCGGFPCTDISAAGKGAGIEGEQSGLWAEMARIIGEIRPGYVFVENSPMLVSRGLGRVLGDLAAMGFDARWGIVSAENAGGFHDRERIWIIANSNSKQFDPLFDCSGPKGSAATTSAWAVDFVDVDFGFGVGKKRVPQPRILRVVDGMANRVERLKAIGNGQVPAVAALAWRTLMEAT